LSTLAVPEICTGELIAVFASGLSMMIFRVPGIGVAAVMGTSEPVGVALALAEAEAPALAEALAEGVPLSSTKVVVLSPPHPASTTAIRTDSPTPNPFIAPS
jgi:hypothetical protein